MEGNEGEGGEGVSMMRSSSIQIDWQFLQECHTRMIRSVVLVYTCEHYISYEYECLRPCSCSTPSRSRETEPKGTNQDLMERRPQKGAAAAAAVPYL